MRPWKRLRRLVDIPFLLVGGVLTFYIAIAAFGLVKNSAEHYSNFILGTCVMTGLLAIRNLCDEKLRDRVRRFFHARLYSRRRRSRSAPSPWAMSG